MMQFRVQSLGMVDIDKGAWWGTYSNKVVSTGGRKPECWRRHLRSLGDRRRWERGRWVSLYPRGENLAKLRRGERLVIQAVDGRVVPPDFKRADSHGGCLSTSGLQRRYKASEGGGSAP